MRLASLALLLVVSVAHAELPSPRFDRLFPLGAAPGSTLEVDVAGADLEDAAKLIFDHPGITAEFVKDKKFQVTIAADVPAGTFDARVVGRYGVSNPRLFAVSAGLVELAEKEPNDDPIQAQPVPVNAAVNGTSDQGREDVFRVAMRKGQRVVVECFAQRLDSQLDATLTVSAADGRPVASNGDYAGRDPLVEFIAPTDGEYVVSLNDLSFRGGHPYRLVVADRPHVENVFPRAVKVGQPSLVSVFGRNLGGKASGLALNDLPLDVIPETVDPLRDVFARGRFRFTDHPTAHSVLPTAATCTLTGFQHRGIPLLLADTAVSLEQEPNDDPKAPQKLTLPAVVSGRFDKERDADWFAIEPTESGPHSFEVYCERIAGRADPYLVVLDEKDNRVGELDDFGIRANAFDGHLRDPAGMVNLTAKQKYRVLVQDRYRRGGPRYQYVLTVRRPVPDFYPAVIHHQNPGPGGTTVRKGGTAYLDLIVHNKDGFTGPFTVTAEGLPKGLHAAPTVVTGGDRAVVVLWAEADAPDFVGPIRLTATAKRGDETLVREVRPYTKVWSNNDLNSSRPTRELVVAVADAAPFAVVPAADRLTIEAGQKAELKLTCQRHQTDFKAAVNVSGLSLPNAVRVTTTSIPEGKADATVTVEVPATTRPGEYTFALQCQAQVPFSKDAKAASRPNTLVTTPSRPVTVVVTAAPGKK